MFLDEEFRAVGRGLCMHFRERNGMRAMAVHAVELPANAVASARPFSMQALTPILEYFRMAGCTDRRGIAKIRAEAVIGSQEIRMVRIMAIVARDLLGSVSI